MVANLLSSLESDPLFWVFGALLTGLFIPVAKELIINYVFQANKQEVLSVEKIEEENVKRTLLCIGPHGYNRKLKKMVIFSSQVQKILAPNDVAV